MLVLLKFENNLYVRCLAYSPHPNIVDTETSRREGSIVATSVAAYWNLDWPASRAEMGIPVAVYACPECPLSLMPPVVDDDVRNRISVTELAVNR